MDILLVDDDRILQTSIGDFLKHRGYRVRQALDGREALRQIDAHPPKLLISDIQMPGMDGIELLRRVRARLPDLPVILITGHGTLETAVEALRNRAYDYLKKPVQLEELLTSICRIENQNLDP